MSLAEALSFCSIFLGLGGTVFFALELLTTMQTDLVKVATLMWGKGVIVAHSAIRQKYDYISGMFLVSLSIVSQISAILCREFIVDYVVFDTFVDKLSATFLLPMLLVALVYVVSRRCKERCIVRFNDRIKDDL